MQLNAVIISPDGKAKDRFDITGGTISVDIVDDVFTEVEGAFNNASTEDFILIKMFPETLEETADNNVIYAGIIAEIGVGVIKAKRITTMFNDEKFSYNDLSYSINKNSDANKRNAEYGLYNFMLEIGYPSAVSNWKLTKALSFSYDTSHPTAFSNEKWEVDKKQTDYNTKQYLEIEKRFVNSKNVLWAFDGFLFDEQTQTYTIKFKSTNNYEKSLNNLDGLSKVKINIDNNTDITEWGITERSGEGRSENVMTIVPHWTVEEIEHYGTPRYFARYADGTIHETTESGFDISKVVKPAYMAVTTLDGDEGNQPTNAEIVSGAKSGLYNTKMGHEITITLPLHTNSFHNAYMTNVDDLRPSLLDNIQLGRAWDVYKDTTIYQTALTGFDVDTGTGNITLKFGKYRNRIKNFIKGK